ncbi:hypothetical protein AB205_0086410 [Aquarana catesbeiana]|uniref:WAP domain-containing protein n=1 Tax=Aquarana catesbeiana TaxID=8400 RepID=A0A2G9R6F5_AQUCT|nr:hypothetical protein AB205_0086410 [Aquarana catesbeiana]
MRPSTVGALFILLGIILLQAASADKKGQCKFYETFAPCQSITRKCHGDAFCPGKQKCCNVHCTMKCDDPR